MTKIILQALVGGVTGSLIISLILLSDGFNPLHNTHLIHFGFSMGALSSLIAAVAIKRKTYQPLTHQLHRYISRLPSSDPNWHKAIDILVDLENREPIKTKTRISQKTRT